MKEGLVLCLLVLLVAISNAFLTTPLHHGATVKRSRGVEVYMARRVQWKATKKHRKTRPRKSRLSDINRTPPPYVTDIHQIENLPPEYEIATTESIEEAEKTMVKVWADDFVDKDAEELEGKIKIILTESGREMVYDPAEGI